MEVKIKLHSADHYRLLAVSEPGIETSLVYAAAYQQGDFVLVETDPDCRFCVIQLEDSMPEALVYTPGPRLVFPIPFGDERGGYSPKSFAGCCHLLRARAATPEEIARRRDLAFNPYDRPREGGFFPHATATVEPQSAAFAARNAIDGLRENRSHGEWPYCAWGINRDPDAALRVDFGRPVRIDQLVLTLRADFPHDSYWTESTAAFSDGTSEVLALTRTAAPQSFSIPARVTSFVELRELKKAPDESPFPALTQLEAWGVETAQAETV